MTFQEFIEKRRKENGEEDARRANFFVRIEALEVLLVEKEVISENEFKSTRDKIAERYTDNKEK